MLGMQVHRILDASAAVLPCEARHLARHQAGKSGVGHAVRAQDCRLWLVCAYAQQFARVLMKACLTIMPRETNNMFCMSPAGANCWSIGRRLRAGQKTAPAKQEGLPWNAVAACTIKGTI